MAALVEGNSLRSVTRMTGIHRNTVMKLLTDLGTACAEYQHKVLVNLPCNRIQCDEIWSFVHAKEKNCTAEMKAEGYGDCWTWVALDADTKLVVSWLVGGRDAGYAYEFMHDVKNRLSNRVQMATDGRKAYLETVEDAFGCEVDYSLLQKVYGPAPSKRSPETRYSPGTVTGIQKEVIMGKPDEKHTSTSYVERQNLTMRMAMRRFTRLTNGFSKKLANHEAAISLHYMHYNFARIHETLRATPAMEAGVTNHVWSVEEIISLLDK